jgi:hypothetical protein
MYIVVVNKLTCGNVSGHLIFSIFESGR